MQTSRLVAAVALFAAAVSAQASCALVRCAEGSTCSENKDGTVGCYKDCKTDCGLTVPHGWSGYGEGSNHCNRCQCVDGGLLCTMMACTNKPCPQEVCKGKAMCGGFVGLKCGADEVCRDDPADSCDPANGGADCAGCCHFNQCAATKCSSGYTCEVNAFGQAECVPTPTICCLAVPTCPNAWSQVKSCTRSEFATGACIQTTLCCTTITCKASPIYSIGEKHD